MTMNSEILTALIGVSATLAGTILGWMLNNLSNRGKLNIYVSTWEDSFTHENSIGGMVPCSNREEVQNYGYKVSFDLYNSSGNIKIMRNVQIVFSDGKKDIEKHTPKDDASKRYSHSMIFYDKVEPINIPPKTVIKLDLHGGAWNKDGEMDFIWKSKKIYLAYTDEKGKIRKKEIKTENYEQYFENHKSEEEDNGQTENAHAE